MFSRVRKGRGLAWLVFVLVTVAAYGNFYVYDSIGPVADLLHRQRAFSDTQIGMLNAIYSMPNVVLVLWGRARRSLWRGPRNTMDYHCVSCWRCAHRLKP